MYYCSDSSWRFSRSSRLDLIIESYHEKALTLCLFGLRPWFRNALHQLRDQDGVQLDRFFLGQPVAGLDSLHGQMVAAESVAIQGIR